MNGSKIKFPQVSGHARLGVGAAVLLALGAAGGAGAVSMTRPTAEMAPIIRTGIAGLVKTSGIVTVKGQVAEVYGDRFVIQDQTGRAMVDAGRRGDATVARGQAVLVQGRFDDGQVHASYVVGPDGKVIAVGPMGPRSHHGPDGRGGPDGPGRGDARGPDGPPPPVGQRPASGARPPLPDDSGCPTPPGMPATAALHPAEPPRL